MALSTAEAFIKSRGPFVSGRELRDLLGYQSAQAFRQAAQQNRLREELPERRPEAAPLVTPHMHGGRMAESSSKTASLDQAFFGPSSASGAHVKGRRRMPPVGRLGLESEAPAGLGSKKHHKGHRRRKQRSAQT